MGRLVALACFGLLLVALAGCSGSGKDVAETTTSSSTTSSSTTPTSTTPAPTLNHPPTGSLTVIVNGTSAAFSINGTDADGDALSWNLTFGDGNSTNGTTVPANATHSYTAAGLFNATLTLDDGTDTAIFNATVNATAAVGAGTTSVVFTGHVLAPSPSYNTEGECLEAIFVTDFGTIFQVPESTWGWAYSFDVDGMTAIFYDDGLATNLQEGPSGTVPSGAVEVIACSELAVDTDYALTLAPA